MHGGRGSAQNFKSTWGLKMEKGKRISYLTSALMLTVPNPLVDSKTSAGRQKKYFLKLDFDI